MALVSLTQGPVEGSDEGLAGQRCTRNDVDLGALCCDHFIAQDRESLPVYGDRGLTIRWVLQDFQPRYSPTLDDSLDLHDPVVGVDRRTGEGSVHISKARG